MTPARASRRTATPRSALPPAIAQEFAGRLVDWQRSHGRSHLPWQNTRDPYRVWLSEIMLQQTQVSTVLGYYERFLARFPTVQDLARASSDEVLGLWSGLGYYSRARNLHRCAQQVVSVFGEFPRTAEELATLPGIGPSTAAAIASFCYGERAAILDGNVKRVLTRVLGFSSDLAQGASERELWAYARDLLPGSSDDMPAYTQGIMDLGATVCVQRRPQCLLCPMQSICTARQEGEPERYPVKTKKLKRSAQVLWLLWARRDDGAVWLERRPEQGIWGGLYCLPVFESPEALQQSFPAGSAGDVEQMPGFVHVLTHKDLHLQPVRVAWDAKSAAPGSGDWFGLEAARALGLPAPIRKLLDTPD